MNFIINYVMLRLAAFRNAQARDEGSLSLENILFITAIAGIATFVTAFYSDLGQWFQGISLPESPDLTAPSN